MYLEIRSCNTLTRFLTFTPILGLLNESDAENQPRHLLKYNHAENQVTVQSGT